MDAHFVLSWAQVSAHVGFLSSKLSAEPKFELVAAVGRGGMVPAVMVANKLQVPAVGLLPIARFHRRDGMAMFTLVPNQPLGSEYDKPTVLLVDAIVNSGATMQVARGFMPNAKTAALYVRPGAENSVHFFADCFRREGRVVFPWEPWPVS